VILSIIKAVSVFFGLLRDLVGWRQREEDRQAGREEVSAKVNAETLETKDAMDSVGRPSDDAVVDRLRSSKF
jgi:hypothetical protein